MSCLRLLTILLLSCAALLARAETLIAIDNASQFETRLLSREEAGERGHPFRDLTPATRNIG